jgi:hypothetical protein
MPPMWSTFSAASSEAPFSMVAIAPSPSGWRFDYQRVPTFQDIQRTQDAFVDTTGNSGGSVQIQGRRVRVSESSIQSVTTGTGNGGTVQVSASEFMGLHHRAIGTYASDAGSG